MGILIVLVLGAVGLTATLGPIVVSWRRNERVSPWIVAALLFGPISGLVWLLVERGRRAAVRRSGPGTTST